MNAAKKKELEASEKRIAELSAIFKRLYEDSVTGRISDERFTELSADYEAEQKELKERAAAIRAELSKAQEATVNAEKFMNVVIIEDGAPVGVRIFVFCGVQGGKSVFLKRLSGFFQRRPAFADTFPRRHHSGNPI